MRHIDKTSICYIQGSIKLTNEREKERERERGFIGQVNQYFILGLAPELFR